MNEDIKNRWVEALRSGDYQQTKRHLKDSSGYCCLGVLCEIAKEDNVQVALKGEYVGIDEVFENGFIFSEALPREVMKWADFSTVSYGSDNVPVGSYEELGLEAPPHSNKIDPVYLTTLNDECGYNFNQIADVIQKKWETL